MLKKVVSTEKELSLAACVLRGVKKNKVPLNEDLEQALNRLIVDSALSNPTSEERSFGTNLNNWSDMDNKYQKTPNDYYNGKTKNRVFHSDNKSPIYKAFDNASSKPKRFTNNKMDVRPYDKDNYHNNQYRKST